MKDLIIRDVEEKDFSALKLLIAEAFGKGWNLGRFEQNESLFQTLLDVYASIFLEPSTFGKVAEVGGAVVGAILASLDGDMPKFRQLQGNIAPNMLTLLTATEDERADIVTHMSTSFQAIGQLLGSVVEPYGGSLELLVVSEQAQGLQIGKMLWNEAAGYFNSKNVASIYLIADSACNTGFYDCNGFSKVGAVEALYDYTAGQKKSDIFVYEYRL